MNNFINKDTKALLVQTFNIAQRNNLLKSLDIDESDKKILESEIKKSKDCYEFISKPFESKKDDETLLKDLENAIHNNPDKDFHGAVLASDAFFPFSDCAQVADEAGIKAIVQPGGSIRDQESIDYCDEHDMTMVFNGYRHFRH